MKRNSQSQKRDYENKKSLRGSAVGFPANGTDHEWALWRADVERAIVAESRSRRADAAKANSWRVLQFVLGVTAFVGGVLLVYYLYELRPGLSMTATVLRSLILVPIEGFAYGMLRQSRVDAENAKQHALRADDEAGLWIVFLVLDKCGKPKDMVEVFKALAHHPEASLTAAEKPIHKPKRRIVRRPTSENSAEEHSERIH